MIRKIFRSKALTVILFVIAAAMILVGSVGGARAMLSVESDMYESQLEYASIGVSLT